MKEAYRIGNAQSIGSYQIQSNYFSAGIKDRCALAVLADGTIDHINGRRCAILAVEVCMQAFLQCIPQETDPQMFFDFVTEKILQEMRDILFLGKMPYLSLSCQFIRNRELFYYTIGTNQVFLFDGRDLRFLSERSGSVVFSKGMSAGIISYGVQEALNERELISYLEKRRHPYDKAQQMLLGVKKKNRKRAGNATVVLVEDCL